jgi:hypothetical protein
MGKWREMAQELMDDPTPEKARDALAKMNEERRLGGTPSPYLAEAMEKWIADNYLKGLDMTT